MATCRDACNRALRKIGRLGAGREPRTADQADTLAAMQGMYLALVASGTFGRLCDVQPLTDYTAAENQRVIRTDATITITLPETVPCWSDPLPYNQEPYSTAANTNARPPSNGSVVQIMDRVAGNVETWIYDGTLRDWINIDALQLDEQAPLSTEDPEGLAANLAAEIADIFGADLGAVTLAQARRFRTALVSNFSRPRETVMGNYL